MSQGSFTIGINPAVLEWARNAAGQTVAEVAKRLGVSERSVDEWEKGTRTPAWKTLRKLALCYHRPLAALLLPEPPNEPAPPPDFRTLPESQRELSEKTMLAIRTARWLQGRAIEIQSQSQPESQYVARKIQVTQNVEAVARTCRNALGIELEEQTGWKNKHQAYRHWRAAIEDLGVLVFQFPFPVKEVRGFSLFDRERPAIVVNEADDVGARIFTLLHEYAHLLLQNPGICLPQVTSKLGNNRIETYCNRFAAAVLIPDSEVRTWQLSLNDSIAVTDRQLKSLANHYHVSKYVVLFRLRSADRLTEPESSAIERRWKAKDTSLLTRAIKPRSGGHSAAQICQRQRGPLFVSIVLEATNRGFITTRDAVTYLGVTTKDLKTLELKR